MLNSSSPAPDLFSPSHGLVGQRPSLRLVHGRSRVAVILNANAKRVNKRVMDALSKLVPQEDLFLSHSIEEAERFGHEILDRRYDVVLAGGGDGTIVHAMNILIRAQEARTNGHHRPPLPDIGVLRLGTGNALASATGAEDALRDVSRVVGGESPPARPLPLVEDRADGNVATFASLGYDAQLLNDYVDQLRETDGPLARSIMKSLPGYFFALFSRTIPQQLKNKHPNVTVKAVGRASIIDPETEEELPLAPNATLFEGAARTVAWATTPYYGFKMKIFPFAERRTDRFHLRISTASIAYLLGHLPSLWNGTVRTNFVDFLVEGARIESDQALPYQTGGDGRGYRKDVDIQLSPRTFRVLDATQRA